MVNHLVRTCRTAGSPTRHIFRKTAGLAVEEVLVANAVASPSDSCSVSQEVLKEAPRRARLGSLREDTRQLAQVLKVEAQTTGLNWAIMLVNSFTLNP